MSRHTAEIAWAADGGFAADSYSRRHEWRFDGGAVVAGSASPSIVPEPMSDPAAVDPEEALVAAAASCHMLWFLSLAREAGLDVASYRDRAEAEMGRIAPGRMAVTRITLRPEIAFAGEAPGRDALDRLHREAHERCFIANALKCEIRVESAAGAAAPSAAPVLARIAEETERAKNAIDLLQQQARGSSFEAAYARSSLEQLVAEATPPPAPPAPPPPPTPPPPPGTAGRSPE